MFSAVNTAFISLTMPSLSADTSSETNALLRLLVTKADNITLTSAVLNQAFTPDSRSVLENCFLYSSLCCSLLAAVGAMLGKEWLQSFDRSGQAGPLEQQGRSRQHKYNGAQQWHLETIILFLPNILLLSVLLFFSGLALFLSSVNHAVAGVVIAFMALGAALSSTTYVAGAISPICPYQTAVSRAIRQALGSARQFGKDVLMTAIRPSLLCLSRMWRRFKTTLQLQFSLSRTGLLSSQASASGNIRRPLLSGMARMWDCVRYYAGAVFGPMRETLVQCVGLINWQKRNTDKGLNESDREHLINAQAACWLFEMTSSLSDRVIVAQNICSLNEAGCALILSNSEMWRRLLSLTVEALEAWREQPMAKTKETVQHFACALYHLLCDTPRDDNKWKDIETAFPREPFHSGSFVLKELQSILAGQP